MSYKHVQEQSKHVDQLYPRTRSLVQEQKGCKGKFSIQQQSKLKEPKSRLDVSQGKSSFHLLNTLIGNEADPTSLEVLGHLIH